MRLSRIPLYIIAAMFLFSLASYSALPDIIPSHWNASGQIDRTLPKFPGAFVLPALTAAIWFIMQNASKIDPTRFDQAKNGVPPMTLLIVAFLALIHVGTLGTALGWDIDISRIAVAMVGALLAGLGLLMPRIADRNYFYGVRTPWTLDDPEVWRLTQSAAGKAFLAAGVIAIAGGLLLPLPLAFWLLLAAALAASGVAIGMSWWFHRNLNRQA